MTEASRARHAGPGAGPASGLRAALRLLLLLVPVFWIPAAVAGDKYLGAGGGLSRTDINTTFWQDASVSSGEVKRNGNTYRVFAGYRPRRWLWLQADYINLGHTSFTGVSDGQGSLWLSGTVHGETKAQGLAFEGVGVLPLWHWGALFAKGGLFAWDTSARYYETIIGYVENNDDGVDTLWGGGFELNMGARWALRAEWTHTTLGLGQLGHYKVEFGTLNLLRRF